MNYEICKKLKEAGFPQELSATSDVFVNGEELIYSPDYSKVSVDNPEVIKIPTLSELIEACGDWFIELSKEPDGWAATYDEDGNMPVMIEGSTPEEAVARLWLSINNK